MTAVEMHIKRLQLKCIYLFVILSFFSNVKGEFCMYTACAVQRRLFPRQLKEEPVWVRIKRSTDSFTLILPLNISVVHRLCPQFVAPLSV